MGTLSPSRDQSLQDPGAIQKRAAQVAQLRRTVTKNGKKTVEVVYLITSDRDACLATLAAWVWGHWEIENRLHWVRDVTYQEEQSLVRTGNAPRVMASPATRSARSTCCRPHEPLCRVPGSWAGLRRVP